MKIKNAFSLFEILLVLGLILLVVTITVPIGGFLSDFFITSEVERLEVFYQYLRQRSMASGKTHILVFDLQKNVYSCQVSKTDNLYQSLEHGIRFGFIAGTLGPPSSPTQVIDRPVKLDRPIGLNAQDDNLSIRFLPSGKITAGTIYLVDKQNKRMGALTCSPSRVSYMRRYSYTDKKWVRV